MSNSVHPVTRAAIVVCVAAMLSCVGGAAEQPEVCAEYIECVGGDSPSMLPQLTALYGENGSCWEGNRDERQACEAACSVGWSSCGDDGDADSDRDADDW